MNLTDLFIIYFTGGAPFAVYYFLQNRRGKSNLLLKTLAVFLLWIFFAATLLRRSVILRRFFKMEFFGDSSENRREQSLSRSQKEMERLLIESELNISIFDLRETIERYVGLTLSSNAVPATDAEQEILRVAGGDQLRLGTICLARRNRNKLARHQTEARKDFLQIVEKLFELISDENKLEISAVEIVKNLEDEEARHILEKMFAKKPQTERISSVEYSEKDLWKPQEPKPLCVETISSRSRTAAKTTN